MPPLLKLPFRICKKLYHALRKPYNRLFNKPKWHNLRSTKPVSKIFGLDRGTPIDRFYTDIFLSKHTSCIRGIVCEIAESTYTIRWGGGK
ncbi:hypothetical protein [Helicobacter sp. 11S03491-1]|uniref:hypothetical protein n=1 Tax=Helicobacter sp. 11S03491-1 TaxID=1476196 RepID=UPI000BC4A6D7|nr:hypothetical protein [Helicobacter sp. 11S03491-1]PAF43791.1 hypothetical protein BKH45_00555 [Helicobacter sp. 11S03491-1]